MRFFLRARFKNFLKTALNVCCQLALLSPGFSPALACGPDFPNSFLLGGDAGLLKPPTLMFDQEIRHVPGRDALAFKGALPLEGDYRKQTLAAEIADLKEAIAHSTLTPIERANLAAAYESLRLLQPNSPVPDDPNAGEEKPPPRELRFPAGMPAEFADYFRGAAAFHAGETNAAAQIWSDLLQKPAAQRHFRSTWAAFMLGKLFVDQNPPRAIGCFEQVRQLATNGFADTVGLAAASLGWQARAELNQQKWTRAIHLYFDQAAAGDPSAASSLLMVARLACAHHETSFPELAQDSEGRQLLTAFFISRSFYPGVENPNRVWSGKWLQALEAAGAERLEWADRLALQAYQLGDFEGAQRWAARADTNAPLACWVRAKLALHDGNTAAAVTFLSTACRAFPDSTTLAQTNEPALARTNPPPVPPWLDQVKGELGTLKLTRREYIEALDLLLRAGARLDAAYIAERVLTPEELSQYIARSWPGVPDHTSTNDLSYAGFRPITTEEIGPYLRYLLARRLARKDQWAKAQEYFPEGRRDEANQFAEALRAGRDLSKPAIDRAEALWQAARQLRKSGLELTGAELDPDWKIYEAAFDSMPIAAMRATTNAVFGAGSLPDFTPPPEAATERYALVRSSADERARLKQHGIDPEKRFHYRYRAADLAWEAAQLMPNNSDATARVLSTAGSWLKARDPKAADRFYKALVRRCRKTAIGREADRIRWFPVLDENGKVIPFKPKPPDPPPGAPADDVFPELARGR